MKSTKSKVLIASLSLICLFFVVSAFKATQSQQAGNKYLTLRTYESGLSAVISPMIAIVYDDGNTETITLERPSNPAKALANVKKINETINLISAKGYELVTTCGSDIQTTYTFIKK
jgi:hypothetical protein